MMYAPVEGVVGTPQIQSITDVDSVQRFPTGFLLGAVDSYWGAGEFLYLRANGSIRQFGLCVVTPAASSNPLGYIHNATEVPNTANLARTLCVAMSDMSSGEFGWFQVFGMVPVNCSASVTADTTFGIAAAGQGGANSAGKQILNARVIEAASKTVAKSGCYGVSGATRISIPNGEGWFRGIYLSGTGVGSGAVVTDISPDGRTATVSVANSAAINGTVTGTYNNATVYYNVAHINRPFAQGAIT